jgi:hypothetical protein
VDQRQILLTHKTLPLVSLIAKVKNPFRQLCGTLQIQPCNKTKMDFVPHEDRSFLQQAILRINN